MLILSYMKGGQAAAWAQNYIERYTVADGTVTVPDAFATFLVELDKSFDDLNKKEKALAELRKLTQGTMTADEFFVKFDITRTKAGLTASQHDEVLIDQLKRALHVDVVGGVMRSAVIPTTYDAWKTAGITDD